MGKAHRISGAVTLTARGTSQAATMLDKQPALPASITFDPIGIDLFAVILHCVFAVKMSARQASASRSRKEAAEYVQAHLPYGVNGKPRVDVSMEWHDDEAIEFTLVSTTKGEQVTLAGRSANIRVQPKKDWLNCVEIRVKSGLWVRIDITQVQTRFPL